VELALILQHGIPVPVIGFVMEAIEKSVSGVIGLFAATSARALASPSCERSYLIRMNESFA
jgi:hypothetical protein